MSANRKSVIWSALSLVSVFTVPFFTNSATSVIVALTALPIILAIPAWTCQATGSLTKKTAVVLLGALFQGLATCAAAVFLAFLFASLCMVSGVLPIFIYWGNYVWSIVFCCFFLLVAYALVGGIGTTVIYQWEKQSRIRRDLASR